MSDSASSPAESVVTTSQAAPEKVIIKFKATGNAPILKRSVFRLTSTHRFSAVSSFLRSQLEYDDAEPLFIYVNSAFAPAPDEPISNLHRCFASGGQLILNYCTTAAWG